MEIQEFPIGKKNYIYEGKGLNDTLELVSRKDLHLKIKELTKIVRGQHSNYSDLGSVLSRLDRYTQHLLIQGDSEGNPVYNLTSSNALTNQSEHIYTTNIFKATKYQRTLQYTMLGGLPVIEDMLVSFQDQMVVIHNMPYEGPLKNSAKFREINKIITTKNKDLAAKLQITCVISDGYLEMPLGMNGWRDKVANSKNLVETFVKYMQGTSTLEDECTIALALGTMTAKWHSASSAYVLKPSGNPPKFPTGIRTRLYYMLGALELPDDYLEWFDV